MLANKRESSGVYQTQDRLGAVHVVAKSGLDGVARAAQVLQQTSNAEESDVFTLPLAVVPSNLSPRAQHLYKIQDNEQ
jgi:hypothetical protein